MISVERLDRQGVRKDTTIITVCRDDGIEMILDVAEAADLVGALMVALHPDELHRVGPKETK